MNRYWTDTSGKCSRSLLFVLCGVGGISAMSIPFAMFLQQHDHITCFQRDLIVFSGGFLFFLLTTPPKIGFQGLLQNMIAEEEATQVYGFVGTFLVATDALMIFILS